MSGTHEVHLAQMSFAYALPASFSCLKRDAQSTVTTLYYPTTKIDNIPFFFDKQRKNNFTTHSKCNLWNHQNRRSRDKSN